MARRYRSMYSVPNLLNPKADLPQVPHSNRLHWLPGDRVHIKGTGIGVLLRPYEDATDKWVIRWEAPAAGRPELNLISNDQLTKLATFA